MPAQWKSDSQYAETRYDRQQLVPGWEQGSLASARVLVVGAGALGNEVLKNLALSGVGHIDIADCDRVELSNLSRCNLFRDGDLNRNKAVAASEQICRLNPQVRSRAFALDIEHDLGAGALRDYDLVLGCVDTIQARLAIDRLCRAVEIVWIDGGMDASGGQVSLFHPAQGPCYTCGMTESMWSRFAERQSCFRLGTGAQMHEIKMAATVTMAASIGAMQAQEAIRWLLRESTQSVPPMMPGERICLQTSPYEVVTLQAIVNPECDQHARVDSYAVAIEADPASMTAAELLDKFEAHTLALAWDVVCALDCFGCSHEVCAVPLHALTPEQLSCPKCGRIRVPEMQSSISATDALAQQTLAALGVPSQAMLDVVLGSKTDARAERICVELVEGSATRAEVHA